MSSRTALFTLVACVATLPIAAWAHQFTVDQSATTRVNFIQNHIQGLAPIGQEFVPSGNKLGVVELRTYDGVTGNQLGATLQVNIHENTIAGAIIGTSVAVPLGDGFAGETHFDMQNTVGLMPGNAYVVEVLVTQGDAWYVEDNNDNYAAGREVKSGNPDATGDLWFKEGAACSRPLNCNNHGACDVNGDCVCDPGFAGASCNQCAADYYNYPTCTFCMRDATCNSHGVCNSLGSCVCDERYTGTNCNQCATNYYNYPTCTFCTRAATCSGHGNCNSLGSCACDTGFTGTNCNQCDTNYYNYPTCTFCTGAATCNNHGFCDTQGHCVCEPGYTGPNCDRRVPVALSDLTVIADRHHVDVQWSASFEHSVVFLVQRSHSADQGYEAISPDIDGGGRLKLTYRDTSVLPSTEYFYRVGYRSTAGWFYSSSVRTVTRPTVFTFHRIATNPSRGPVRFEYEIAEAGRVQLDVYSVAGRHVATLQTGALAGAGSFLWDGRDDRGAAQLSGLYVAKLSDGGQVRTRKFTLVR